MYVRLECSVVVCVLPAVFPRLGGSHPWVNLRVADCQRLISQRTLMDVISWPLLERRSAVNGQGDLWILKVYQMPDESSDLQQP